MAATNGSDYMAELSYGKKLVGIGFNPSGDEKVTRLKELFAEALDIVDGRPSAGTVLQGVCSDLAIQQIVLAQMAAVKAVTWGD